MARLETIELSPPKGFWLHSRAKLDRSHSQKQSPIMSFIHYTTGQLVGSSNSSNSSSAKAEAAARTLTGASASAVSILGHTEPLIPAPDMLTQGPAHPLYTMEPMMWVPIGNPLTTLHFLTPAHIGVFRTRNQFAKVGPNELKAHRERLFPLASSSASDRPFYDAVFYGSVVSWRCIIDLKTGEESSEQQGIVVLTFVRQSSAGGHEQLRHLCEAALAGSGKKQDANVAEAQQLMPQRGPVAMMLVVPLAKVKDQDPSICFQTVAPFDDLPDLQMVSSSDVTRVWRSNELGALGEPCSGPKLAPLRHRTGPSATPIDLVNPAQPTQLRKAMESALVQERVLSFVTGQAAFTSAADGATVINDIPIAAQRARTAFPSRSCWTLALQ